MADIFLSYSRGDLDRAKVLMEALEGKGWSVWWDRTLRPGETWDDVIEREITAAKCVITLWSRLSVKSDWVKQEADEGQRRGIMVSVLIDAIDLPWGFRRQQAAELVAWDGDAGHPAFQLLVEGIEAHLPRTEPGGTEAHRTGEAAITKTPSAPVAGNRADPPAPGPPVQPVSEVESSPASPPAEAVGSSGRWLPNWFRRPTLPVRTGAAVLVLASAWGVYSSLQQSERERYTHTEIVAKWNDNTQDHRNTIEAYYPGLYNSEFFDLLNRSEAQALYETTQSADPNLYAVRQSIVDLLNYFEVVALMVDRGIADEDIVRAFAGSAMMRWYSALAEFAAVYNERRAVCVWAPYYRLMEAWGADPTLCG